MRLWQVTPTSRPQMACHVCKQFSTQTHADKRLCLVINGPAWDDISDLAAHLASAGIKADLILRSETGKSNALNVAVDHFRSLDATIVVRDDDDLYLPGGLAEFDELLPKHDIVAQNRHWVSMDEELWLFNHDDHSRPMGDEAIWGGNFAFRARDAIPFPDAPVSQCYDWTRAMVKAGAMGWLKSPRHAVLCRNSTDHLWQAGETMVRYVCGSAGLKCDAYRDAYIDGSEPPRGELFERPDVHEAHLAELKRFRACA